MVLHSQMHWVTFLIIVIELVFFCHQLIYALSRPSDKNRLYYLILLYLLIQHNIISGLLPDNNIPIPIMAQHIIAHAIGFTMGMYIPYYFYKAFNLTALKFYAYRGSFLFLLGPFLVFFVAQYYLTDNFELSKKQGLIIPFFYAISFLYALNRAIRIKNKEQKEEHSKKEIIGVYIGVVFWASLPIISFLETNINDLLEPFLHNGSQLVKMVITNLGLVVITALFIRRTVFQSRQEYVQLQNSTNVLQELHAELIFKVKERTRELEDANEKIVNSFMNLAHETKTPLTLINNYLEDYIQQKGETKELEVIKNNLAKLTKDMVNFLDMERLNKGFIIYNGDQCSDFSAILKECTVLFRPYASKKNIVITELIQEALLVKAAPECIYRMINNLVENAIKYTRENGQIEVVLKPVDDKIIFSVIDNGIGISPELHTTIFEPYYQINSQKANYQGMGLGLAIVKKIVDTLQGEIQLHSDPLKIGTEIILELPLYTLPADETISKLDITSVYMEIEPLTIADKAHDESKPTLLVVEDNISLLNLMVESLREKYNVHFALSGWEALEKLKTIKCVDLIVSDVMMDNGTGMELCKGLSLEGKFNHIPFIFITAQATMKDKMEGLALGAIDYIFKPFLIGELTAKIDAVLNNLSHQRKAIITLAYNSLLLNSGYETKEIPLPAQPNPSRFEENCNFYLLTSREKQVINVIKKGHTANKEISELLHISDKTVGKHLENIFIKVGVNDKLELMVKLEAPHDPSMEKVTKQ